MDAQAENNSLALIGARIKELRQQRGLTQEELAGPEFTKGYVSALERSVVLPSFKALEVFARRLGVPIAEFVVSRDFLQSLQSHQLGGELEDEALLAVQEDLLYQANYAKMLIRTGQVQEALELISDLEKSALPYQSSLPPSVAYLPPFLRGRAHLQLLCPGLARPELEAALEAASGDPEAEARVRNLLGVVFFEMSQPRLALEQHVLCAQRIKEHDIYDLNFKLSVYGNMANEYWALSEPSLAISVYKEVLPILEDLNDTQSQAKVYWDMAAAYKLAQDWPYARLYATKALYIYEANDNRVEAASICLSLAETFIVDRRYDEAAEALERAEGLLAGTGNRAVSSYLYRAYADLARLQGDHEGAFSHAGKSVKLARSYYDATIPNRSGEQPGGQSSGQPGGQAGNPFWQDPSRVYAEALQMEALVEEGVGRRERADILFKQALALIEPVGFEETKHTLHLSYAKVLQARGDFEGAVRHYQIVADLKPRALRG